MRLIDADAMKVFINKYYRQTSTVKSILSYIDTAPTIVWCSQTSDGLPLLDLRERPKGEWIEDYTAKKKRVVACNKCRCLNIMGKSNFCPNCGADMRGKNNEQL